MKKKKRVSREKKVLHRKRALKAWLFLTPSLAGVSVFVLIPFIDVIRRSFYEAMSGKFVGLYNFNSVLHNEAFLLAAKNTLRFLGVCIPLLLVISLFLTVLLAGIKRFRQALKSTFLVPMAIPVASVVLLWRVFFHNNGLLNQLVTQFGGTPLDYMNSNAAFGVLVFSYIWKNAGYDMVLWLAGLSGISESLYEAASIDGAGAAAKLFYITLPELMPTIYITTILSTVNSFKVFREAYLIAGNYPHNSIYMLQHIFNNWFIDLDVQKMCAGAVLMALVVLLFIFVVQRLGNEKDRYE